MKLSITIDCIYRCKLLGSLSTFKIVTKSYILYVHRVLHQPLSEIPVMRNLMQVSERGFSISIVKTAAFCMDGFAMFMSFSSLLIHPTGQQYDTQFLHN